MIVWKSDEKMLIFGSLIIKDPKILQGEIISPCKIILFEV